MSAPTADKIIPPMLMLIALLTAFVAITAAMSPTISSNIDMDFDAPEEVRRPDYLLSYELFNSIWEPDPYYTINPANISENWRFDDTNGYQTTFTNAEETDHDIDMYAVSGYLGGSDDNVDLHFQQWGGTLGLQSYKDQAKYPEDFNAHINLTGDLDSYIATFMLRHQYTVILAGDIDAEESIHDQILDWRFNVTIYHSYNDSDKTDPWVIVGQFFTFSLPGIPQWLNVLLAVPIMLLCGICCFILIRGALPF